MAHQAEYPWKGHPRLVLMEFTDHVSADEVTDALDALAAIMDRATMPLHTVLDFSRASELPEKLLDLMVNSNAVDHDQCGYFVFLGADEFVKMIAKILRDKALVAIEFSADEAAAWEFFDAMGIC